MSIYHLFSSFRPLHFKHNLAVFFFLSLSPLHCWRIGKDWKGGGEGNRKGGLEAYDLFLLEKLGTFLSQMCFVTEQGTIKSTIICLLFKSGISPGNGVLGVEMDFLVRS